MGKGTFCFCLCLGERSGERRHRIATHSKSLFEFLCNWKFPWLSFGGDDLVILAFMLCGKVVFTPLGYLIEVGNKNFLLVHICQPHPTLF